MLVSSGVVCFENTVDQGTWKIGVRAARVLGGIPGFTTLTISVTRKGGSTFARMKPSNDCSISEGDNPKQPGID